jgi:hypothetical protein
MPSLEEATALKLKGNAAFAAHDWLKAVDYYSQAIEANDQDPSFYCNRAQVSRFCYPEGSLPLTIDPIRRTSSLSHTVMPSPMRPKQ